MIKHILLILIILAIFGLINCGGGGGGSSCVITYDANEANSGMTPKKQSGDPIIIADNSGNLSKDGYLFDGWNSKPDGTGTNYAPGSSYSGDSITLYAKWAAIFDTSISQNSSSLSSIAHTPWNSSLAIIGLTEKGKQLSNIIVPSSIDGISVLSIAERAFSDCLNIVHVTIADSIINIGANVFSGCNRLDNIIFKGTTPPSITLDSFSGCSARLLVSSGCIDIYKAAEKWNTYVSRIAVVDIEIFTFSIFDDNITITGLTDFGKTLNSIDIPENIDGHTVTEIGDRAFYNYGTFSGSLTIASSVIKIGESAFYGCDNLNGDLVIPSSVLTIGDNAFLGCGHFEGNLIINNGVITIGNGAFQGCSGFKGNLTIPDSVITIGNKAFWGCTGFNGNFTLSENATSIGELAFASCYLTGTLIIPDKVTTIGNRAFASCSGFTGLTISSSVITIGNGAFEGCSNIYGILSIPNSITTIDWVTFSECSRITQVIIPSSVLTINSRAFANCNNLTKVKVENVIPPTITAFDYYNPFYDNANLNSIEVPSSAVTTYQSADGWSEFAAKIVGY